MAQPSKRLRNMDYAYGPVKELRHVALVRDVQTTLNRWRHSETFRKSKSIHVMGLLIGDLALSFYAKPRYTDRVEVLYPNHLQFQVGLSDSQGTIKVSSRMTHPKLKFGLLHPMLFTYQRL